MNLRIIGLSAFLMTMLVTTSDVQARIYKTVDADGNVVFTDVPPKDHSKALEVNAGNTYQTPPPTAVAPSQRRAQEPDTDEKLEQPVTYSSLRIVTPSDDAPVRENAGNLNVIVSVSPTLKANHSVQILIDGAVFATDSSTDIQLTNVDRGTHMLTAQIIDGDGSVIMSSNPSSFHMMRVSVN